MVTSDGPDPVRGLTFSSLHHDLTSLAQRECFRDPLRIHGIRGRVASQKHLRQPEARRWIIRIQIHTLNTNQNSNADIQATYWNIDPDYECLEIEESMAHHRDPNAPQKLDAAALAEIENDKEMIDLYQRIDNLTKAIDGRPKEHSELVSQREKLYTKAAKKRRTKTGIHQ
ncbi:uncharacterized protein ATNIH1004_006593 [Aspergillus tanneri]|uniref:Uncharacterized protein n=1 Tax=Aspergillus tanneri TaxID=1220188 RepID=A0A5M9MLL0_9EURO|nr:uncharacterized protein ATNIH1004_006593 [Aspergillus tanneri]KAA8647891.1 hypothetical protein ATNIH1004_006593 [Aspergillus tanneri]